MKRSKNIHGDVIHLSTNTMKNPIKDTACAVIAVACLALGLVGLVIGCLLGQPISLFTKEDKP